MTMRLNKESIRGRQRVEEIKSMRDLITDQKIAVRELTEKTRTALKEIGKGNYKKGAVAFLDTAKPLEDVIKQIQLLEEKLVEMFKNLSDEIENR